MVSAQHLAKTCEWGTPRFIVDSAHVVMGGIDLDPASSAYHNQTVEAKAYFTKEDDGLKQRWHGRVFLNPPGDRSGQLVKEFWAKLMWEYLHQRVTEAIWVGFSLEQLVSLQKLEGVQHPLKFPTCIPRSRLKFGGKGSPTHGNYVTYLGPWVEGFVTEFQHHGIVLLP